MTRPLVLLINMPSRKKKSKAKGRKAAAGKGGAKGAEEDNVAVNEQKKQGTLDSEMQRLKIGDKQADEDDVEAMLEQAIKLAAVEEQEMKGKEKEMKVGEKENCTHGYNHPSSRFQARYCENYLKSFTESFHNASRNSRRDRLQSALDAFKTAHDTSAKTTKVSRNRSNFECINLCCVAEGTTFILDGKSDDARLCAVLALYIKRTTADELPDPQNMIELLDGDEHTLVQFFRKQIPCSCLDEKYKQVKSITKMGICFNESCPLPGNMIRSKMLRCTGCINGHNVSYCSRACQEADWPKHKIVCGKTAQEIAALRYITECTVGDVQE